MANYFMCLMAMNVFQTSPNHESELRIKPCINWPPRAPNTHFLIMLHMQWKRAQVEGGWCKGGSRNVVGWGTSFYWKWKSFQVSKSHSLKVSKFQSSTISKLQGCGVASLGCLHISKFQSFTLSKLRSFELSKIQNSELPSNCFDIDAISKILKNVLEGSSGFVPVFSKILKF